MNYLSSSRSIAKSLACAACLFASAGSQAAEVVSAETITDKVMVQNVRLDGQTVRGEVVNKTGHRLEDVQLLIAYNWLWRNETNPGPHSPAWATTMVLSDALSPNEVYEFAYDPQRTIVAGADGEFHPSVKIVGLTEYSRPEAQYGDQLGGQ